MFFYVQYTEDKKFHIVEESEIDRVNIEKIDFQKKYKIKWTDGNYYEAVIVNCADTMAQLEEIISKKRPKIPNYDLLKSCTETEAEDSEDDIVKPKKKSTEKKLVSTQNIKIMEKYKKGKENEEPKNNSFEKENFIMKQKILSLEAEIKKLKTIIENKTNLEEDLLKLNLELQHTVIDVNKELIKNVVSKYRDRNDINNATYEVGAIVGEEVHLGQNIFISKESYDTTFSLSKTGSQFVKNMAMAVFGASVLKNSSVTGKSSNRIKTEAKPSLNGTKLQAVQGENQNVLQHTQESVNDKEDENSDDEGVE